MIRIIIIVILLIVSGVTIYRSDYYHDLYMEKPKVKIVEKQSTVQITNFNTNRASVYKCLAQPRDTEGVSMICANTDKTVVVKCTSTPSGVGEYYC